MSILRLIFIFFVHLKSGLPKVGIILCILIPTKPTSAQYHDTIKHLSIVDSSFADSSFKKHHSFQPFKRVDSLLIYAKSFTGKKYKRGGTTLNGFDCSGFTMIVFAKYGIRLPHTSSGQSLSGIEIKKSQIEKGNLVFFRGRNIRSKRIGHVGIVISNKGEPIQFIHSSTSHGVRVDRMDAPYYKKRFVKATRIPL